MKNKLFLARQSAQADEVLVQEIIELRACLHQVGLNASDSDIMCLLNNTKKARAGFRASLPDKRLRHV